MENNPRAVFERLFGDSGTTDVQLRAIRACSRTAASSTRSRTSVRRSSRELGTGDRAKLTEYLDAVRDVERRIQNAEAAERRSCRSSSIRPAFRPRSTSTPKLMFDLQVLAYQCGHHARRHIHDGTRVHRPAVSGDRRARRASSDLAPPGRSGEAREARQDQHLPRRRCSRYFLEKLQATPDGDGTLLDHVTLIYGAGMSEQQRARSPRTCRSCWPAAARLGSRPVTTSGSRRARRWRI